MFLLDTNIVSDLRRPNKALPAWLDWARNTVAEQQFISCITVFELEPGVRLRERRDPRQGQMLRQWLEQRVLVQFENRVIDVNTAIAQRCAAMHVPNPAHERDAWIAATAIVHDPTVVSRNVRGFAACGSRVLNPWEAQPY